ncbi:DUF4892 domain-containing protein [Pseudoteredinibacter isoporae]|uniref:DUF4892 domain-containing protein n=1 Tax=Pseudoteredinibacter isoporae TaxID=570281 RepID=A0A7X0JX96_9GAMM|nr:DUF4892 domain-containing protein [Pseudoteredinibacter isoporae]MBB6523373.1 hypothetical protein [Pseudoteredinibacter isoporae]NHO88885.1 DUF4892 domain-containing protein [Pseudoteredinibacter isoporae]NIB24407.1 DUF4892 domain-containing protein [Pseudoteredinibacter isoporae]
MNVLRTLNASKISSKGCVIAFFLALSGFLSAAKLHAEAWVDVPGVKAKRVIYEQQQESSDWVLPLGPIERVDGLWQPEQSRQFSGDLLRRTLEFDTEQSEAVVFRAYRDAILKQGVQTLFSCQGRDCGRSNNWANRFFGIYQLYGREDSQRLSSFSWRSEGREHFALLYLVRRGNQRIYLQQEWLSRVASEQSASVLVSEDQLWKQWRASGVLRLSQAAGQLDNDGLIKPEWLELIGKVLQAHPGQQLDVVAHHYGAGQARDQAESMLARLQQGLAAQGVAERRLQTHNLADLAPLQSRPESARLDLLLR